MKPITIGKSESGAVTLDIPKLIVSRALVSADSGGGKSYLLRKIMEEVSKTTQTIVIDPEGEFASLREIRDMVLVGSDGEVPADPLSAGVLCRKLMEMNLSAVIDLSELTPLRRQDYVKLFCETMVSLPRELWHRCFVFLDEAHEVAPEGEKSASEEAIASLSSKGRKRGYCLIPATQRLSKLSKNVAAGLKNQFLGTFSLDTDIKRAAGSLGFDSKRFSEIRDLSSQPGHEGEFFCFGPALNHRGVLKMRGGKVSTTHPQAGHGKPSRPPEPSAKIKGALPELTDLSKLAQEEAHTLAEAKRQIADLKRELKKAAQPEVREVASRHELQTIRTLRKGLEDAMKTIHHLSAAATQTAAVDPEQVNRIVHGAVDQLVKLFQATTAKRSGELDRLRREGTAMVERLQKLLDPGSTPPAAHLPSNAPSPHHSPPRSQPAPIAAIPSGDVAPAPMKKVERAILIALAQHPEGLTKNQAVIYAGYKPSGDTAQAFRNFEANGWIAFGLKITITQAGLDALGHWEPLPTGAVLREKMIAEAPAVQARILRVLFEVYPDAISKADAVERAGYKPSGDTAQAFRIFDKLEWTRSDGRGVRASDELFQE